MIWAGLFLAVAFAGWRVYRRLRFCLHVAQLEGYKELPYLRWMAARPTDVVFRVSHALGMVILAALWLSPGSGRAAATAGLFAWAVAFASSRRYRRDRPKKPLVTTPRLVRIATLATAMAVAVVVAGTWAAIAGPAAPARATARFLLSFLAADLLAPAWVAIALVLLRPVESRIQEGFKRKARARLAARPDLVVVAITGSYGKTSVKFAAAEMLAQRYNVLATPGSFNTPMGVCKVINEQLRPEHQVLVLEMGIRHAGDIAELCAIARPHVAVITSIGVAHLETMGSVDAIAREKGSLFDFLLPGGIAVLDRDDARYEELAARAPGRVVSVSASGDERADLRATDIGFGTEGTRYVVQARDGATETVVTPLLGRHHVSNTLLGLAVADVLDVRLRPATRAAARLRPVPHRLALRQEQGLWILDDAFNSNPVGAAGALEVLSKFEGRRFVITPGMVELGDREDELNEAFGRRMASSADEVWLVGPARTRPIARGLRAEGFPEDRLHVVGTLFEARDAVRRAARPGDVVLYENDLPDQYTEAT